ncbi:hypothetical protein AO353_21185 [Pseudomonas fluorescens]|uniref:Polysaccharide biosynthesis protein n=1 Tax=Pseudomonas fluorescens TaxID=294 RepID=A0A0N9WME1_PSEFL|nr:hypothetical protein AO353_21185 [Pseudomonas fluorescens]
MGGNLVMARLLMPEMFGMMVIATTVSVVLHLLSDVGLRQNIIQSPRGDDPVFLNTAWTVQILRGVVLFTSTLLIAGFTWFAQVINLWSANSTYAAPELPLVLAFTGFTAIIFGFQSTKLDLAVCDFQQKKVVLAEFASQLAGLLVMLGAGYFTRSIWFGGSMSATELGAYSIAVLILGALQIGAQRLVGAVAMPAFSEVTRVNDTAQLRALYYRIRLVVDLALLFVCGLFLTASPFIISCLYDERYAQVGSMMAILPLSFFTLRYGVAHQLWLALGLTKYQAMDNIIRVVSLWVLLPLLLALGVVVGALVAMRVQHFFWEQPND